MSNLSDLLPAGAAAKQLTFTDSGSGITSKKPVVLESDGDVTEVSETATSESAGTQAQYDAYLQPSWQLCRPIRQKIRLHKKDAGD